MKPLSPSQPRQPRPRPRRPDSRLAENRLRTPSVHDHHQEHNTGGDSFMNKPINLFAKTVAALLLSTIPAWTADPDRELVDNVRKAIKDAGLERAAANLNVFSREGGGLISLSGRAPTEAVKKKLLAVVNGVPGVKKVNHQELNWPSFDMVVKTSLKTNATHEKQYMADLRRGYFKFAGGFDDEYTEKDGPVGDGIVPFRVVIEHTSSAITFSAVSATPITGNVVRVGADQVFNPMGNLGPGYRFNYEMTVRETGNIKYTFQKWDGAIYKDLYSATFAANTSNPVVVAWSNIELGKPPATAPMCPLDDKTCREKAVNALKPPTREFKTMTGVKISGTFADSSPALVKRVKAAKPKELIPCEVMLQNNSPWSVSAVSCYLTDPSKKGVDGYFGTSEFSPRLLPGEKRKITVNLSGLSPEEKWDAKEAAYYTARRAAYLTTKNLIITKIEPHFDLRGILD